MAENEQQTPPSRTTPPRRRRRPKVNATTPTSGQKQTRLKGRAGNRDPRDQRDVTPEPDNSRLGSATAPPAAASQTPLAAKQAQATAAAFAGVFSASPAASSLPIPSFCAKPSPPPTLESPFHAESREPADPDSDDGINGLSDREPQSEPDPASGTPAEKRAALFSRPQESPLDRIFRADREEKAKARGHLFLSPQLPQPGLDKRAGPIPEPGRLLGRPARISPQELDGTPGRPIGPAFSTPYHERMNQALRTPPTNRSQQASVPRPGESTGRSEALKRCLFGDTASPSTETAGQSEHRHGHAVPQTPTRSTYDSIYGGGAQSPRSPDLKVMEDSLRRILNLKPGAGPGNGPEKPKIPSSTI